MSGAITLYGIPNCDTVKRARAWLAGKGGQGAGHPEHRFHDFKKHGVPPDGLARWAAAAGWDVVLNRKGSTWRQLSEAERAEAASASGASALALAQPSVIKRPVVEWPSGEVSVGFTPEQFERLYSAQPDAQPAA